MYGEAAGSELFLFVKENPVQATGDRTLKVYIYNQPHFPSVLFIVYCLLSPYSCVRIPKLEVGRPHQTESSPAKTDPAAVITIIINHNDPRYPPHSSYHSIFYCALLPHSISHAQYRIE